ncbi:hypothetical protein KC669_04000 [Candidatus Dojkabacteria bacterium]|uniref:Uncharacterized protein n=1 Tax=Candidatus Dojkabacteria bacterium TaxID=2099670 RepID=A0A955LAM1_9BACT|nr:hypothetical protein [Candidatus Dojkabacteria bacterium]
MKKFKTKVLFTFLIALEIAMTLPVKVSAQDINYKIPNPSRYNSLEDIISALGSLIRPIFLLTFGAMLLVGAFLVLTSQGNEEKIENGKKTIIAAIIGFAIAALAPTLVNFVTSFLLVEGL